MFNSKNESSLFNAMIGAALVGSVALVVTVLVEAVLGMQTFL